MIHFYNNVYHSGSHLYKFLWGGGGKLPVKTTVGYLYLFEVISGFWCLASKAKSGSFRRTFYGTEPKYNIKTNIKPRYDVIYVDKLIYCIQGTYLSIRWWSVM